VETPVMELSDVLLTKSGGETERQVYFVQSTGALGKATEVGRAKACLNALCRSWRCAST
jgi:histidyl-tRNA synthetase